MPSAILVQKPAGRPEHLFLLLHGVGATAEDMIPLAHALGDIFPRAMIVSVDGLHPSDISAGRQWFSIRGITEENRVQRVADAMPEFVAAIHELQKEAGLDATATTLLGFSQGGIMALESTMLTQPPAARVVALSSRFAKLPGLRPRARIHLIHGEHDDVIPCTHTLSAAARLHSLDAGATADVVPDTDHEINAAVLEKIVLHLTGSDGKQS